MKERRELLYEGLDIVEQNRSRLTPEESDLLKAQLLSGFAGGEIAAQINERLSEEEIMKQIFPKK